jgi:hypothetical protein
MPNPRSGRRRPGRRSLLAAAAALAWLSPFGATAHDIPYDVTIHVFLRPEGQRLRLLVRAPIGAMRDVVFPTRDQTHLDLARADGAVRQAALLWLADAVALYENGDRLPAPAIAAAQISLPSDRSFRSYDAALSHATGAPLPRDTALVWNQALMDVLFEYRIQSDRSAFSIDPAFARLGIRVATSLRFLPPGGAERAFEFAGDPGLVRLDPSWRQAAATFVRLGFRHTLDGVDHLLFLLCLVIPYRRLRPLVLVVTGFTAAHSITLVASAFGFAPDALWFPPLVETAIAASIVYMALENIVGSASLRQHRWVIAFAFGLVHGFGFSFALRQTLQFAGSHVVTSLLAFNVGVELGQIAVLLVFVPALHLLFRFVVAERIATIILSAIVAHTAWHWMIERGSTLSRYEWPVPTAGGIAIALRWTLAAVGLAAAVWVASVVRRHARTARTAASERE